MKNVNMIFLNVVCYQFSLEAGLQGMAKNNTTEKQKLWSDIKACAMKTDRRENVKFIVTNYKDRFTS